MKIGMTKEIGKMKNGTMKLSVTAKSQPKRMWFALKHRLELSLSQVLVSLRVSD